MFILSPLEQFNLIVLIPYIYDKFDFSITNACLISLISLIFLISLIYFLGSIKNPYLNKSSFFFIPNIWQLIIEFIYNIVSQLLIDLISIKSEKYFPFISVIFIYILFNNLIGLIPYTFTTTSHLIITFSLSFSIFIGINILCFKKHKIRMFSIFCPANSSFLLALIIIPIEFISYIFKPVSLGVRLFVNLMAGHSLIKIIVGFSWSMIILENIQTLGFLLPLFILLILMGLEIAVAIIQTYVFVTLTCIYLNEGEILH